MNRNIGIATAYGYALSKGYTGTEEEFAELMARLPEFAGEAAESAQAAETAQTAAANSATAASDSAVAAVTAQTAAGNAKTAAEASAQAAETAQEAAEDASEAAANSAGNTAASAASAAASATAAENARTAAETARDTAAGSAADAAGSAAAAEDAQEAAEDAAESISQSAAQIGQNAADIADLKSALTTYTGNNTITFTQNGYINLSGNTVDVESIISSSSKEYAVINCSAGDVFTLSTEGAATAAPFAFVDASGNVLFKSEVSSTVKYYGLVVTAPANTAKLVLNNNKSNTSKSYYGEILQDSVDYATWKSDALSGRKFVKFVHNAAYETKGETFNHNKIISSNGVWQTAVVPCASGDIFTITQIYGSGDHRAWAFVDASNNIIKKSAAGLRVTSKTEIVAPVGAVYAVFNHRNTYDANAIVWLGADETQIKGHNYDSLYVGNLVSGELKYNGVDTNSLASYRVSTKEVVAIPSGSIRKININIPVNLLVQILTGADSRNLIHDSGFVSANSVVTINNGDNYYALSFCKNDGDPYHSTTQIATSDIDKGLINLSFISDATDKDEDSEKKLNASRLSLVDYSGHDLSSLTANTTIAHTSDCHGDYQRVKNFLDFCDRVGVNFCAITGDIVPYKPSEGLGWFKQLINSHNTMVGICPGNHDTYGSSFSDADLHSLIFDGIETKTGNNTQNNWYYYDLANSNIRVISINLYEYGGSSRNTTHFSETQLNWLCSTLANTPNNYGVILLYHSPQIRVTDSSISEGYTKFFQTPRTYSDTYSGVTGSPINDIVDAFIGRTTISKTYTQTGSPSSVSVSADFSSVNISVEFIAHLTGHLHQDSVYYMPTTQKQLMLNVVCTNALYGGSAYPDLCEMSDLPRGKTDVTQNAFNVYTIDRTNKKVKITRIGSTITYDMDTRDYMEIPYAD